MIGEYSVQELQPFGNLVEPMAWGYVDDMSNYFPSEMFARFAQVFDNIWVASSFKGSSGMRMFWQVGAHKDHYLQVMICH